MKRPIPELEDFAMRELIMTDLKWLKEYKDILWNHWTKVNKALEVATMLSEEDEILQSMNIKIDEVVP